MIPIKKENFKIYLYILREIIVNWIGYKMGLRKILKKGLIVNIEKSLSTEDAYADKGLRRMDFLRDTLKLKENEQFPFKNVMEVGPGGMLLLGLMLVAEGCDEYIGVDSFPSLVWGKFSMDCYRLAMSKMSHEKADKISKALNSSKDGNGPVKYFGNVGIENIINRGYVKPKSMDLIFSWGVLEHIKHPKNVFNVLRKIIKDDGVMIHSIDPYPHTWTLFPNPYIIFCMSNWLWNLMYNGRGFLNRFRASDYIEWAKEAGFEVIEVKREMGDKKYLTIRKNFTPRFKKYLDNDILTESITLILKPIQNDDNLVKN